MSTSTRKEFLGEFFGTFLLVFFGLSAVVLAAIIGAYVGLVQVALIWGLGLIIAITLTGPASGAHLNPAITLAFATQSDFPWKKIPHYLAAQCLGAFLGSLLMYLTFSDAITAFEETSRITRGTPESVRSAMVFGEFYPNPAAAQESEIVARFSFPAAFLAELLGTALLAFIIFTLVQQKRETVPGWLIPILIGVSLVVLISLFAPISMGGFNPARDLMPRLASSLLGWESLPFAHNGHGWFTVYIVAPLIGAQFGAFLSKLLYK